MILFDHRINSIARLRDVPTSYGVEVDLRDYDGAIRLAHDPFVGGERLEDFLREYRHAGIIFNVKSDGLEAAVIQLAKEFGIEEYFLLDVANPTLVRLAREGFRKVAVRYSEFEPLESALAFAGSVDWVWVDCFTKLPLDSNILATLQKHFRVCLVSPELQRHPPAWIADFKRQLGTARIDAVCSDHCGTWAAL